MARPEEQKAAVAAELRAVQAVQEGVLPGDRAHN